MKLIRKYFVTGLLVLLPVIATFYILGFLVNFAEGLAKPVGELLFWRTCLWAWYCGNSSDNFPCGYLCNQCFGEEAHRFGGGYPN